MSNVNAYAADLDRRLQLTGRNAKELLVEFSDSKWQTKFVRFHDLVDILADCIIANDYKIPDDLNECVVLTQAGSTLKDKLIRKSNVPAKEAQLMCALTVGHQELFVDVLATDIDRLANSIDRQIREGQLRFPFIWGRELYDAYASLFDDEKDVLTLDESLRLLDAIPAGVFQYGAFVIGPYGLQRSSSYRNIQSGRRVPAYHCSQPVCHAVHTTALTTGHDAGINAHRDKLYRLLEDDPAESADWQGLAREISSYTSSFYNDHRAGTLIALVGDCLSLVELRKLVSRLFDKTSGRLRKATSKFLLVEKADDAVKELGRSDLLQLMLMADEPSVSLCLDELVREGEIQVPRGEVRKPVTNMRLSSGAFRLSAELGHFGVRFVSSDPGFASLRERELLHKLYVRDDSTDTEELDWQLRGFEADDIDERLEEFFRSTDPRTALQRMILARKTNMITACEYVGLEDGDKLSDTDLVETVLWKLGFNVHFEEDPHAKFWDLQQRISALTQSSRISGIGDSETFRGVASSYFAHLEGLLVDALAFSTWGLTTDHTSEGRAFSYDDERDRATGLRRLQLAHTRSQNGVEHFDYGSEKLELYALIRGFAVLADELEHVLADKETHARPVVDLPDYDGKTELKRFVLRSVVPFLDLTSASQGRLLKGLREISRLMLAGEVHAVRNDYSHYRRTSPEVERMARALEAIEAAVRQIENLGLSRQLCWPTGVSYDAWGRSRHTFSGPRSFEYMFARPSNYDWMGLPSLTEPQFLMRAASLAEPNEVLRFTRRFESDYSRMWDGYPTRRSRSSESLTAVDEVPSHPDDLEMSH